MAALALCLIGGSMAALAKEAPPTAQDPVVEARMVQISEEPVSYTHLTLPTTSRV